MPSPHPVVVALGTRPEIIKLAPVIKAIGDRARVVHTGQHYDSGLSAVFFEQFGIDEPEASLGIGGKTRVEQIGQTRRGLKPFLDDAAAVVVQGDTNTTLGAALAGSDLGVPVVHVEAGLRSYDRQMPEEHNRIITDHLSAVLCAPTPLNSETLEQSGVTGEVHLTGNTIVEALHTLMPADRTGLLTEYGVQPNRYALATFHRPENVDDPGTLAVILEQLASLEVPVLLPLHPRTLARIERFELDATVGRLAITGPIGYREFIGLAAESALLISDSGGVQEEASVIKRPVIVVRRSTERPEVLGTFGKLIAPGPEIAAQAHRWLADIEQVHAGLATIPSPYGPGDAAEKIATAMKPLL